MSKLKAPQEKKQASLTKDRRNDYGENSKASRKNIPRSKARAKRSYRRGIHQALHVETTSREESVRDRSETRIADQKLQLLEFRKYPDIALAEHIQKQKRRRE